MIEINMRDTMSQSMSGLFLVHVTTGHDSGYLVRSPGYMTEDRVEQALELIPTKRNACRMSEYNANLAVRVIEDLGVSATIRCEPSG